MSNLQSNPSQNNIPIKTGSFIGLVGPYGSGKSGISILLKNLGYTQPISHAGYELDYKYFKGEDGKFEIACFTGRVPRAETKGETVFKNAVDPLILIPEDKRIVDNLAEGLTEEELINLSQKHRQEYTVDKLNNSKISQSDKSMYCFYDLTELQRKINNKELYLSGEVPSKLELGRNGELSPRCYNLVEIQKQTEEGKKIFVECEDSGVPNLYIEIQKRIPNVDFQAIALSPITPLTSKMLEHREGDKAPSRINGNRENHEIKTNFNQNNAEWGTQWRKLVKEGKIKNFIITSRVAIEDITLTQKDGQQIEIKKGQEFSVNSDEAIIVSDQIRLNEEALNVQYITKFLQLKEALNEAKYQYELAEYHFDQIPSPENRDKKTTAFLELQITQSRLNDLGEYGVKDWSENRQNQENKNNQKIKNTEITEYDLELAKFENKSATASPESQDFIKNKAEEIKLARVQQNYNIAEKKLTEIKAKLEKSREILARNTATKFLEKTKDWSGAETLEFYLKQNLNEANFTKFKKALIAEIETKKFPEAKGLRGVGSFAELSNLCSQNRLNPIILGECLKNIMKRNSQLEQAQELQKTSEIKKSRSKMLIA